jgi:hypothetical protein
VPAGITNAIVLPPGVRSVAMPSDATVLTLTDTAGTIMPRVVAKLVAIP